MLGKIPMSENPKKDVNMPELLTLSEACELLKVHPNTLRQWDKKGVLPAIRIGTKRIRRYRKEDIIKMLDEKI
ncbi:MAG: helix-turn-helix domain-containing protein [Candidatus Nomurabacteria bacterium]|nr:MAG: helix-turn-helix domain-containing protein [Candidatus Nomurabacteria bacterium]